MCIVTIKKKTHLVNIQQREWQCMTEVQDNLENLAKK